MQLVRINKNPSRHDLRMFAGVWFPLFCAALGVMVWRKSGSLHVPEIIWGAGAVLSLAGLVWPALARWLSLGLSYATFPIGFVMSHLVVGVVYFLVITPIGFLQRRLGRDALGLRLDRSAQSYWTPREQPPGPDSYFHEY